MTLAAQGETFDPQDVLALIKVFGGNAEGEPHFQPRLGRLLFATTAYPLAEVSEHKSAPLLAVELAPNVTLCHVPLFRLLMLHGAGLSTIVTVLLPSLQPVFAVLLLMLSVDVQGAKGNLGAMQENPQVAARYLHSVASPDATKRRKIVNVRRLHF